MRLLHIGDIVGRPGRDIVVRAVPTLKAVYHLDLLTVNAENAAAGSGINPAIYKALIGSGVDGITLGDHIYRRGEIRNVLESESNIVKPANYPEKAPGRTSMVLTAGNGVRVGVISVQGRLFMKAAGCPWSAIDRVLEELPEDVKVILVDFHAEATSEMQVMGRHLDGRVTAVLGTHTHVPTADECILPGGTAFQCDVGMTGPYDSILGRRIDRVLETTLNFIPTQFDVARGDVRIAATLVDVEEFTGKATGIERLCVTEAELERLENQLAG